MKKLNFLDVGFLLNERRETPMHVGGVSLYTLPDDADEQVFLRDLAELLCHVEEFQPPYGDRLKTGPLGLAGPVHWEPDNAMDIEFHVRHSALPKPGRYRELFNLVSRLHGTLLDRNRPLWEMHLIEGLQNRQFAVYAKTHHAAVDGERSIHLARSMLSSDPADRLFDSPFSQASGDRYREKLEREHPLDLSSEELHNVADVLKARLDTGANIYGALKRLTATWMGRGGALSLPFYNVPRSSINTSVDGARRFVAQSWPFARVRAVGKAFDGSFNDAVLAMCSGALRRYLQSHGELPEKSLKALVPVSLRRAGDLDSSNAVASINADLATNIEDPIQRIAAIRASTLAGKEFLQSMSPAEAQVFSTALQVPGVLAASLGFGSRLPAYNTVISNVPGISEPMYWNGARLDGNYPVSVVTEGVALNITLVTYDKNIDFGIIACRRSIPHAQRLIDYMEESLLELEVAAGLAQPEAGALAKTKAASKAKTKAKRAPGKKKATGAKRATASRTSK